MQDLLLAEVRAVGLVDLHHERLAHVREARLAAEVLVDDPRGRGGLGVDDVVLGALLQADGLAQVVVEGEVNARNVGEIRRDISAGHLDLAVLHVLRVDELDGVEDAPFLEQDGADEAVEVAAGHEPEFLCHGEFLAW